MTQANDICLPTPLSIEVFGRPEDWEWIEPSEQGKEAKPPSGFSAKLEETRLSA